MKGWLSMRFLLHFNLLLASPKDSSTILIYGLLACEQIKHQTVRLPYCLPTRKDSAKKIHLGLIRLLPISIVESPLTTSEYNFSDILKERFSKDTTDMSDWKCRWSNHHQKYINVADKISDQIGEAGMLLRRKWFDWLECDIYHIVRKVLLIKLRATMSLLCPYYVPTMSLLCPYYVATM